jgi:hypothetical protein
MKRRVGRGTVDREPRKAEKGRLAEAAEDGLGAAHRGFYFLGCDGSNRYDARL